MSTIIIIYKGKDKRKQDSIAICSHSPSHMNPFYIVAIYLWALVSLSHADRVYETEYTIYN